MKALVETSNKRTERVFLIGVQLKSRTALDEQDSLAELAELARTAGGEVVGDGMQKLDVPAAATYLGKGKAEEFSQRCKQMNVDTVVFDDELSPAQTRNLERVFSCKILDRTALILDIFAQRARTREGKLQVEKAQLEDLMPRLTRYWTHLSRQKGGIGMRGGEGESQLEADRRKLQERVDKITEELELVRRQRSTQRRGRQRSQWPLASIVGYTNAGKSTLFNLLTGGGSLAEDKLFATLDPMTRRLRLPTNQNVLLSDTVGFIRKLPHRLVDSFKATLEEVVEADLLVHVVDASHPNAQQQIESVNLVLKEIGAAGKSTLMVFNKVDRLEGGVSGGLVERHPSGVTISALHETGVTELKAELGTLLRPVREFVQLRIPHEHAAVIARLHEVGQVIEKDYNGPKATFKARIPPLHHAEFERFLVQRKNKVEPSPFT